MTRRGRGKAWAAPAAAKGDRMHGHLLLEAVHGGGYLNSLKAIPLILLLLLWTKLLAAKSVAPP